MEQLINGVFWKYLLSMSVSCLEKCVNFDVDEGISFDVNANVNFNVDFNMNVDMDVNLYVFDRGLYDLCTF